MTHSRGFTPHILAAFFTAVMLALVAASAWSHGQANRAAQADGADSYVPADEKAPVSDAVIEATS